MKNVVAIIVMIALALTLYVLARSASNDKPTAANGCFDNRAKWYSIESRS